MFDAVSTETKLTPIREKILVTVSKNRFGPPGRRDIMWIRHGLGIDNYRTVVERGVTYGLVDKRGTTLSFAGKAGTLSCVGLEKFWRALQQPENVAVSRELVDAVKTRYETMEQQMDESKYSDPLAGAPEFEDMEPVKIGDDMDAEPEDFEKAEED